MAAPLTAEDFKRKDLRTHVYEAPEMYVGSDRQTERSEYLLDPESKTLTFSLLSLPEAVERIFLELLYNAADNAGRSRRGGASPGSLEVTMDRRMVTLTNGGLPIPVEMHAEEKVLVPEMVFGTMLTGSNFKEERHDGGRNGIGAKACNIFSTYFAVEVDDGINGRSYSQVWTNNMRETGGSSLSPFSGESRVTVSYEVDFTRFGYSEYPPEAPFLFAWHCACAAFTAKVPVSFNGFSLPASLREYARLYFGEAVDNALVHYQWRPGMDKEEVKKRRDGEQVSRSGLEVPQVELLACDTPDAGRVVAFANHVLTRDGGAHVVAALKAVSSEILAALNDKEKKGGPSLSVADVRNHVSVVVAVHVLNPSWRGQAKTYLSAPTPLISIPPATLKIVSTWNLRSCLMAALEAKLFRTFTKGEKKLRPKLHKTIDANEAGKKRRRECILCASEGKSGRGYVSTLVSSTPNGADLIGMIPLKGKGLNVTNATPKKIYENEEIRELKAALGLEERRDYSLEANFSRLRYGGLMIMADADVDGDHIKGLIINLFARLYPTLLRRGYVMYWSTPVLRVIKGRQTRKFYTEAEYEQWISQTPDAATWAAKYYKGLGTSTDANVREDMENPHEVIVFCDEREEETAEALGLAFDKKLSDARKEWIARWQPIFGFEGVRLEEVPSLGLGRRDRTAVLAQPVSWFVHSNLVRFSIADLLRSIPRLEDGLKPSQRKALYGAMQILGKGKSEMKVAVLAPSVAARTRYHHGEGNLDKVIVKMAQNYVGSNNLPYFRREGQFGTRMEGGADAASSRYLFTGLEKWVPFVFRKEDEPLLEILVDEGDPIEPEVFYPVIPMGLINGAAGIGTGHRTFLPNHNPLDAIAWLRSKLRGEEAPPLLPWYRGFRGQIELVDRSRRRLEPDIPLPAEQEREEEPQAPLSLLTRGSFSIANGAVQISELPVGRWTLSYRAWLDALQEKGEIKSYRGQVSNETVSFEIRGCKRPLTIPALGLQKTYSLSTLVFLGPDNRPVSYRNTEEVAEAYYSLRLTLYEKRRNLLLAQLGEKNEKLTDRIRFIRAVVEGKLPYANQRKAAVLARMTELDLPAYLLDLVKLVDCTLEKIRELEGQIEENDREMERYRRTSPQALWLADLAAFEEVYRRLYR